MTQTEDILRTLKRAGESGITPREAMQWFGCMRLAARISDIKETLPPDEEIVTLRATSNGKTYARYVLQKRASQTGLGL